MREGVERDGETEREKTGGEGGEGRWCFNAIPAGLG